MPNKRIPNLAVDCPRCGEPDLQVMVDHAEMGWIAAPCSRCKLDGDTPISNEIWQRFVEAVANEIERRGVHTETRKAEERMNG